MIIILFKAVLALAVGVLGLWALRTRLMELPERSQSWEVSEAGLMPRDFVGHSPVSGPNNPIAPPLRRNPESHRGWRATPAAPAAEVQPDPAPAPSR